MKKLIAVTAALVAMSGAAFAQSISAWNEVKLDPINVQDTHTGWGELRERMHASVTAGRFSAEARYEANLKSIPEVSATQDGWFKDGAKFQQLVKKANIYIRPVDGLELILGSDYDRHLPGTYRTDASDDMADTYIGVAKYGYSGFGLVFTGVENLVLGLTVPAYTDETIAMNASSPTTDETTDETIAKIGGAQLWGKGGGVRLNFAAGYTVAPIGLSLGAVVNTDIKASTTADFGAYVGYEGLPGLRVGVGYTGFENFQDHDIAAVVGYDAGFIGVEVAFDYLVANSNKTKVAGNKFQIDGGVKGAIGDAASWYVYALYQNTGSVKNGYNVWVKPGVSCTLGNHTLGAAVQLGGTSAGNGEKGIFKMKLPLTWKYTFN